MDIKRTKIVCTIGPASSSEEILHALIKAGMNVARLNFSHGTYDEHAEVIRKIRAVSEELGEPIAILQDLQGPKIRVGVLPVEGVKLEAGGRVVFTTGEVDIPALKLPVTYEHLHEDVKPGERILLDDGLLSAKVLSVEGREVICTVIDGGTLTSHKGVNFPESKLSVSAITEKDKADLKFGVSQRVDWVALSFVRSAKEARDLRKLIADNEAELGLAGAESVPIRTIAKIEKGEAVRNIDEIIEAIDAVMVARGDLGIEMPAEEVPIIQKMLIAKCLKAAKPVIVATQMLDSMIRNPRPTRAEVSDVANAVIDHADAVMLSGETASGKYPVEAVTTMANVIMETEASPLDDMPPPSEGERSETTADAMSKAASALVRSLDMKLILVASTTGDSARLVSRYRPERTIHVATDSERVRRQLTLSWGVMPFLLPKCDGVDELIERSIGHFKREGGVVAGDRIVVVAGESADREEDPNLVEIREVR